MVRIDDEVSIKSFVKIVDGVFAKGIQAFKSLRRTFRQDHVLVVKLKLEYSDNGFSKQRLQSAEQARSIRSSLNTKLAQYRELAQYKLTRYKLTRYKLTRYNLTRYKFSRYKLTRYKLTRYREKSSVAIGSELRKSWVAIGSGLRKSWVAIGSELRKSWVAIGSELQEKLGRYSDRAQTQAQSL
ncbi:hypothetical protein Rs2_35747 [Raphanus sativus]|nr:hypothetical protein Rs2_35747 [Raphanus sativus]